MATAPILATPATLLPLLAAAKVGATFKLAAENFGMIKLKGLKTTLSIDASAASLTGLEFDNCAFITWRGGAVAGGAPNGYAVRVLLSTGIRLERLAISDAQRGIVFDRCTDFAATGCAITRLVIDGIDVASSQRGLVAGNVIWGFQTGPAHPDSIQLWSRAGLPPTADITIEDNVLVDAGQGIFCGNSQARRGSDGRVTDDGGFDRLIIRRNVARTRFGHAIAVYDGRNCTITDNHVEAIPGSWVKPGGPAVNAAINLFRTTGECWGNRVPDVRNSPAAKARPA